MYPSMLNAYDHWTGLDVEQILNPAPYQSKAFSINFAIHTGESISVAVSRSFILGFE